MKRLEQKIKRLPDAELEVMKAVWAADEPVTRTQLEQVLGGNVPQLVRQWRAAQNRLVVSSSTSAPAFQALTKEVCDEH